MAMPAAAPGPMYKAALSAAYAASLRVSEVVALKVSDIDSERLLLRIEQGKGRKDRLRCSPRLLDLLRDWYRRAHARPRAKMDRASGSAAAGRRPSRHQARNRRGGWVAWETASLACALRGVAQGCAVLRFVSFVLAPMRLAPGAFFQTAGSAGLVASSSRMVRLRRGRCAVHCLTSARGMSAHW